MTSKIDKLQDDVQTLKINEAKHTQKLQTVAEDVSEIKEKVNNIDEFATSLKDAIMKDVSAGYTTLDKFEPVKLIAYGAVGAILLIVLGAVLAIAFGPNVPVL